MEWLYVNYERQKKSIDFWQRIVFNQAGGELGKLGLPQRFGYSKILSIPIVGRSAAVCGHAGDD